MSSYFFTRGGFRSSSFISSPRSWASIIAALPVLMWTHDSFYTICRVRGSSMEPTLKDGDIVLVRRSDHLGQQRLREYFQGGSNNNNSGGGDGSSTGANTSSNENNNDFLLEKDEERKKVREFEKAHCSQTEAVWIVRKPPVPATGDIVVFRDPTEYPSKWNIKRVIGLGGQVLMMPSNRYDKHNYNNQSSSSGLRYRMDDDDTYMRVITPSVPPYSIWIEGDNTANSIDSKDHGPVSKKLMMGIAEYVLWPPSRMGSSLKSTVSPSMQSRAYWP